MFTKTVLNETREDNSLQGLRLLASGHLCDFLCKVLFSLLDTLALFEAEEASDGDVTTQLLSGSLNVLADLHVLVLDVGHVNQAVVVVELADTTLNHLFLDGIGLLSVSRIVSDLSQQDVLLLFQNGSGNLIAVEVRSGVCN